MGTYVSRSSVHQLIHSSILDVKHSMFSMIVGPKVQCAFRSGIVDLD